MQDDATLRFARISKKCAGSSGVILEAKEITGCNISVLKTLPAHRATEIQHDVQKYLEMNSSNIGKISEGNFSFLPEIDQVATPIYIISLVNEKSGKIVYIGKAASKNNRFQGGHSAFLKLLNPIYNNLEKFISFSIINVTISSNEVIPIEWVSPSDLRDDLISHIEHSLIWKFQPELNSHLKNEEPTGFDFVINLHPQSREYVDIADIRVRARGQPIVKSAPSVRKIRSDNDRQPCPSD